MPQDEQVLVIQRKVFESAGVFHGLAFDVDRYLGAFFQPGVPRFLPRSAAETDPMHKQLIPYVLISCGGRFLTYVRGKRAGETRLVGNRSIGIGGHINPIDDHVPLFSGYSTSGDRYCREAYDAAVIREVSEEIAIDSRHIDRVVALLNDDSTEVGRVHLGIVHHWSLEKPQVAKREQMMTQLEFMTPDQLAQECASMETWSLFCLDLLPRLNAISPS